ncbi:hypothetical protein [Aliiruegeria lutimaris]|uniref:Uncharacterized protein n=1 Tax=Aliiruegeria lutimaris TaxID=571298 RepID=A0A1G8IJ48_9RHOB|nr:hypothetical protein [Aliiruegeria lutimaris]SDI18924.1 hypothetical protein SAMN04488026_100151 [Aliiruegeria lutimaris]
MNGKKLKNQSTIKNIHFELSRLIARLGPAPSEPRPVDEACDIYTEIRFANNLRANALAAVCYWCGLEPADALEREASWT